MTIMANNNLYLLSPIFRIFNPLFTSVAAVSREAVRTSTSTKYYIYGC